LNLGKYGGNASMGVLNVSCATLLPISWGTMEQIESSNNIVVIMVKLGLKFYFGRLNVNVMLLVAIWVVEVFVE